MVRKIRQHTTTYNTKCACYRRMWEEGNHIFVRMIMESTEFLYLGIMPISPGHGELNKIMYTKCLPQCVAHSKFSINRDFIRRRHCSWTVKEQDSEG